MAADRLSLLQAYHAEDPEDAFTCFALAHEHAKRGNTNAAISYYETLVKAQPSYTGTYYHLGKLYLSQGLQKEARAVLRSGIAVCSRLRAHKDLAELKQVLMALDDA